MTKATVTGYLLQANHVCKNLNHKNKKFHFLFLKKQQGKMYQVVKKKDKNGTLNKNGKEETWRKTIIIGKKMIILNN